jgi:hypothetical protein
MGLPARRFDGSVAWMARGNGRWRAKEAGGHPSDPPCGDPRPGPAAWRAPSPRFASGKASRPEGPLATKAVRRAKRPAGPGRGALGEAAGEASLGRGRGIRIWPRGDRPGGRSVRADASGSQSHRGREGEADMRGEGRKAGKPFPGGRAWSLRRSVGGLSHADRAGRALQGRSAPGGLVRSSRRSGERRAAKRDLARAGRVRLQGSRRLRIRRPGSARRPPGSCRRRCEEACFHRPL